MTIFRLFSDPETGEFGEDLRPRNVPNPKLQRACEAIKFRALHPGKPLPQFESRIVNELLLPKPHFVKLARFTFLMIHFLASFVVQLLCQ